MKTIVTEAIDIIKYYESCKLEAYLCPAGKWTIGYGHTKGVKKGMKITQEEAETLLSRDLHMFIKQVENLGLRLNPFQTGALVSLVYNIGIGNLSKSQLLKELKNNPESVRVYREWIDFFYSKGRILKGLFLRRRAELDLYFKGISRRKVPDMDII